MTALHTDVDPAERAEWPDALDTVVRFDGPDRARELLQALFDGTPARAANGGGAGPSPRARLLFRRNGSTASAESARTPTTRGRA
jgi:hypothetical protein